MNDSAAHIAFLRHGLATIRYRADNVIQDAPESYGGFELGEGTRTPSQILSHISDVLTFIVRKLDPEMTHHPLPSSDSWSSQVRRFLRTIQEADRAIAANPAMNADTAYRLLQGPLADVLTHIGQLAMLRRCAGAPIAGENFFKADIKPINPESS